MFGSRCLLSHIRDKDIPTSNWNKSVRVPVSPGPVRFRPFLRPVQPGPVPFPAGSGQFFDNFSWFLPVHYGLDLFCSNSVRFKLIFCQIISDLPWYELFLVDIRRWQQVLLRIGAVLCEFLPISTW